MPRERRMVARSSFASKKLLKCTDSQFMLFVGLIVEADDEGRGEGEPEALKMKFPNRKWSEKQIEDMMRHLNSAKLVEWYTNDGGLYYEVINFLDFQQGSWHGRSAKKSQMPSPYVSTTVVHRERCMGPPEAVTPSTVLGRNGPKGSEVKGSEGNISKGNDGVAYTSDFESFWKEYPRKKDKGKAYRCWNTLLGKEVDPQSLIKCAKNYTKECNRDETEAKYIKLPATFLGPDKPHEDYVEGIPETVTPDDPEDTKEYVRQFREGERNGTLRMDKEKRIIVIVATGEKWEGPGGHQHITNAPGRSEGKSPPY